MKLHLTAIVSILAAFVALAQISLAENGTTGWHRMRLGNFEVTALSDSTLQSLSDVQDQI